MLERSLLETMVWSWRRRLVTLGLGFGMSASVVEAIVQSGGSASAQVVAPSQYTSPTPSGNSVPFDTLVAIGIVVAFLIGLLLFYMLVYRQRGGGEDAEEFDGDKEAPKEPEESSPAASSEEDSNTSKDDSSPSKEPESEPEAESTEESDTASDA